MEKKYFIILIKMVIEKALTKPKLTLYQLLVIHTLFVDKLTTLKLGKN